MSESTAGSRRHNSSCLSKETFIKTKNTWSLFAFCFPARLTTWEVRSQRTWSKRSVVSGGNTGVQRRLWFSASIFHLNNRLTCCRRGGRRRGRGRWGGDGLLHIGPGAAVWTWGGTTATRTLDKWRGWEFIFMLKSASLQILLRKHKHIAVQPPLDRSEVLWHVRKLRHNLDHRNRLGNKVEEIN